MKYVFLFIAIQIVALILAIIGLPICALLSLMRLWKPTYSEITKKIVFTWSPEWAWLWSNDEDGILPPWYAAANPTWGVRRLAFSWTVWRNSVGNLRFVRGVSGKNRPLWTWYPTIQGTHWYIYAGWHSDGWPTLTAGRLK
jgi:hypothetical protein